MTEEARRVRVAERQDLADGVVGLVLEPLGGELPAWEPGSHVDVLPDGGEVRQYSLCGSPGDRARYRVAVLRVDDGRGGSVRIHDKLSAGDELDLRGPRNHFRLEPAASHLFIAGGIGITPILPMVATVAASGSDWSLVYGGRSRRSMAFLGDLETHGDRIDLWPQDERGLLDLPAVLGEPVPGRRVYCCGPEPLLAAVEQEMRTRPGESLHTERFAPKEPVETGGDAFEVEVASTGARVVVAEDESIIDALAGAGIDVDFSCREGTCGTCETGVLGGVPEHRDSVLGDDERAANDCMMICVGRCRTGPLILDL
ncbi:PDR/VanB family oxidoreductase [Nocardioides sp. YIM B13467]|uniref:PDR/VanB family oxidoreductase n=1 Tax=Nocardioides sp. YIM B13467 TaxID=3366294 RepID=UPI00366E0623